MTRRRLCLALLCAVLVAGCGCNRSRKKVIGVVPKATSHLFWVSVQAGAMAAAHDFNVDVVWNGPATETDYGRQIEIVESLITRHVDGLAVAAAERQALVGTIDRAVAAGIPVTIFDSGLDSENYMTFLSTNNYEAGRMGAHTLAKLLNGKGKVAVVLHAPGSFSTMERERGFNDVIAKEYPQIRIVASQYGFSSRAKARDATENMLTAHPDLDGLFASTEPSSTGASLALKSREVAGKVKFVGFDASDSMVQDLKDGTMHAMVVQDPFRMGYEAVKTLVDKLNGKTPPKHIDLSARVVTKVELNTPAVQALLNPDLKKHLNQ